MDFKPTRKLQRVNLIFFLVTGITGVVGTPIYLYFNGLRAFDVLLFLFFFAATGLSITMGYHRLFAHVTYKAGPFVQFFYLLFGAAAFEQSAFKWASQHRDHHLYTDTDRDPYSSRKGFWYSHIGWLVFWSHYKNYGNVHDLEKNRMVMHQHNHYLLWSLLGGIALPTLIGALAGRAGGAFIMSVCFRIAFVHNMTFCINSFCHFVGKKTYDIHSSARDHWLIALLTFGEGYHNFHHRFPSDYRNGIRWYHWDPSKWGIAALSKMNLVRDLKKVSSSKILYARISAQRELAEIRLQEKMSVDPSVIKVKQMLDAHYAQLQRALGNMEKASAYYRSALNELRINKSADFRRSKQAAFEALCMERARFQQMYQDWLYLVKRTRLGLVPA